MNAINHIKLISYEIYRHLNKIVDAYDTEPKYQEVLGYYIDEAFEACGKLGYLVECGQEVIKHPTHYELKLSVVLEHGENSAPIDFTLRHENKPVYPLITDQPQELLIDRLKCMEEYTLYQRKKISELKEDLPDYIVTLKSFAWKPEQKIYCSDVLDVYTAIQTRIVGQPYDLRSPTGKDTKRIFEGTQYEFN